MEKKTIVKRAAVAGVILLVLGLIAATVLVTLERSTRRAHSKDRERHQVERRKELQAYLDETAQRLRGLPPDPRVVAEIFTRHNSETPRVSMYVWGTRNDGTFVFGVPAEPFLRLNAAFDRHRAMITEDNHYASRDQFLRALLHYPHAIPLIPLPEENDGERRLRFSMDSMDGRGLAVRRVAGWRFHPEYPDSWRDDDKNVFFLSSPIDDGSGQTVGRLNMKVVEAYARRERADVDDFLPIAGLTIGASLFWLWFLLPTWVYIDARERGVARPLLWAFLTLVGSVFALLVYLISRPAAPEELRCPRCAKVLNGSKAGCPYCGADLSGAFCQQCQYPLKSDWAFCPSCRTPAGAKKLTPAEGMV